MNSLLRSITTTIGLSAISLMVVVVMARADPVVPGEEHCVVNVRSDDRLNMRTQPHSRAGITARKRYGDCGILVHNCSGSWCSVEDGTVWDGCTVTTSRWSRRRCIASRVFKPGTP